MKESAGDVLAEAKEINAKRAKAEAEKVIEDTAEAEPKAAETVETAKTKPEN